MFLIINFIGSKSRFRGQQMSMSNLSSKVFMYESFLPNEDALQILSYADTLSINKPSFVFNTKTKENETNVAVRKSQSITVDDIHAVDFIKSTILDQFEKSNSDLVVKLARDHVTFIKYSAGEFFDWHRDHEKYVINQRDRWIEAHLIYCLKAPQVGGNLDIKKDNENIQSIAYKYNQCVVFDKLMEHRAAVVQEGEKLIMTVDVLISTKEIASDESLDFELAEAMKDPVGIRSYRIDKINQLHDAHKQSAMFGVFVVGTITLIYDSLGYYFYDDKNLYDTCCFIRKDGCFVDFHRGDVKESVSSYSYGKNIFNNDDLTSLMINQFDYYDVKDGSIDPHRMNSPPIPDGTDPLAILKIKCCHIPKKLETISYTYYCNEGNEYDVKTVDHSCGLLHLIEASLEEHQEEISKKRRH